MVGRDVFGLRYETIAVVCHIMLDVSAASLSDFEFGGVGVGWSEIWNAH